MDVASDEEVDLGDDICDDAHDREMATKVIRTTQRSEMMSFPARGVRTKTRFRINRQLEVMSLPTRGVHMIRKLPRQVQLQLLLHHLRLLLLCRPRLLLLVFLLENRRTKANTVSCMLTVLARSLSAVVIGAGIHRLIPGSRLTSLARVSSVLRSNLLLLARAFGPK